MESRYADADGLRMHYLESAGSTPVIAIHGWPETSHEWRRVAPLLAPEYRVLAPDTRGHGKTAAPSTGYDRATLARDIVAFMDALGIERCPVVAHDWGGIIAVKLALDHPERVERLCLMDTLCTGWPTFVNYFYWFMDGDRAERFFARHARAFIEFIIGGHVSAAMPAPPEGLFPLEMVSMTAPSPWADAEDLSAYAEPYLNGDASRVSCAYYRELRFHRVVADSSALHGERYEPVSTAEMGAIWRQQNLPGEYLDFAPEDRHTVYSGPVLWLHTRGVAEATGVPLGADGIPRGDAALDGFPRHFPDLQAIPVDGGHFFVEERPEETAARLRPFLAGRR